MEVRQYYYTSYTHQLSGRAGFQVKAMSAGITPEMQSTIARLIAYRIPPDLDVHAYAAHPVALRYYCAADVCVLLCSRSSGSDEYGRPGNFFAHAIVAERAFFQHVSPIQFWQSSFWHAADQEERADIVSLPTLSTIEVGATLDLEDIWRFLDQGKRRSLLYSLLCAIIYGEQRRIIIFDSAEHVALWIAAASYLLPPPYRAQLTFATYHHDPRQTQYFITGAIRTASSLAFFSDPQAYFVLDAQMGQTSSIEASRYARLALEAAWPRRYQEQLLPLFDACARLLPDTNVLDQRLDLLALHAGVIQPRRALTPEEQSALRLALNSLSTQPLPQALEEELVAAACPSLALADCTEEEIRLCRKYRQHMARLPEAVIIVESLIALTDGEISEQQVEYLRSAVARLAPEEYQRVLKRWMPVCLRRAVSQTAQQRFIQALFPSDVQLAENFWQLYLEILHALYRDLGLSGPVLAMFDCCFTLSPRSVPGSYSVQQCFILLAASTLVQDQQFAQDLRNVQQHPWSASLQLVCRRSQLLDAGAALLLNVRRYVLKRDLEKLDSGEVLVGLFQADLLLEKHCQLLDLCPDHVPHLFWPYYWKQLLQLLQTAKVDLFLTTLAFWFELSYECLGAASYFPQEFFLGLPTMLRLAMKSRASHEAVLGLHEFIEESRVADPAHWHRYIAPYVRS